MARFATRPAAKRGRAVAGRGRRPRLDLLKSKGRQLMATGALRAPARPMGSGGPVLRRGLSLARIEVHLSEVPSRGLLGPGTEAACSLRAWACCTMQTGPRLARAYGRWRHHPCHSRVRLMARPPLRGGARQDCLYAIASRPQARLNSTASGLSAQVVPLSGATSDPLGAAGGGLGALGALEAQTRATLAPSTTASRLRRSGRTGDNSLGAPSVTTASILQSQLQILRQPVDHPLSPASILPMSSPLADAQMAPEGLPHLFASIH